MTWRRFTGPVALVAVLAVGAVVGFRLLPEAPAQADGYTVEEQRNLGLIDSSGITSGVEQLLDQLAPYTDAENERLPQQIDGAPNGYAQVAVRTDESAVDLYWKGPLPETIDAIVDANPGVEVHLHDVPWSLIELASAQDEAWELLNSPGYEDVEVQSLGVERGARAFFVEVGDVSDERAEEVAAAVERLTGVPAHVDVGHYLVPAVGVADDSETA